MVNLDLSTDTLGILAWSKVILFIFSALALFFIYRKKQPFYYVVLTSVLLTVFYIFLAWPLQKMWWGSIGDELFIAGFLGKVLLGNPWTDFYYDWLPNFYPPLYFWVTGLIARPFAHNAIVAAKLGVAGTILLWFLGSYLWQNLFWQKINNHKFNTKDIIESAWFWYLLPVVYFLMLDFDTIILKPYEAISALFSIILLGIISRSLSLNQWTYKQYLFFGISGGLLFLTYYFWWIFLVPTLFVLVVISRRRLVNIKRIIYIGLIILLLSSVFWAPLLWSYFKYGIENSQATHFVPQDFFSFVPWHNFSVQSFLYLLGLAGLIIFFRKSFVKSSLIVIIFIYLYQIINIISFLLGGRPVQASKAWWFLGTAAMAVGLSYGMIYVYNRYLANKPIFLRTSLVVIVSIILLSRAPFVYFIDDPVVLSQIEKDLVQPKQIIQLAEAIKLHVPDYKSRTWLSSGSMELGVYLPLSYYIAHNVHFSHHAALHSTRILDIEEMSLAKSAIDFMRIIDRGEPRPIDSLLLYNNPDSDIAEYYVLYFWQDNFPNGGLDREILIPQSLITEDYWDKIYDKDNWLIFLKK